jgi:hypothetical protein
MAGVYGPGPSSKVSAIARWRGVPAVMKLDRRSASLTIREFAAALRSAAVRRR